MRLLKLLALLFLSSSTLLMALPQELSVQEVEIFSGSSGDGQHEGYSVAVNGDILLISTNASVSHRNNVAYLYQHNGTNFVRIANLGASDLVEGDHKFGASVDIDGDTIVISDLDSAVYVYTKPPSGWVDMDETAKLTASDLANRDNYGFSIAVSGDTIVVGSKNDDDGGYDSGSAYIYVKPSSSAWINATQIAKIHASDTGSFGNSVAIDGNNILIGAYMVDGGSAYLFEKPNNGNDPWVSTTVSTKLVPNIAASYAWFGSAVAIEGTTIAIGATGDPGDSLNGAVYIFESTNGVFEQKAKLTTSDNEYADDLSFQNSLSIDGDIVVVGARDKRDEDNHLLGGTAYLYKKPSTGWTDSTENNKITASNAVNGDYFGWSIALSGEHLIVGAMGVDNLSEGILDVGATYIFNVEDESSSISVNPSIIMYLLN